MLAVTAIAVIRVRNLFAVVMLSGIYSLLSAGLFVVLDAVDVAFTEAAVGVGVATVLLLGALLLTTTQEKATHNHNPLLPLAVVTITGAVLIFGISDLPPYGNPANPIHQHVAPRYIEQGPVEVGVPNMVTAVLASYRGYDTLGETVVVFTAAIGVLALLARRRDRHKDKS